MTHHRTPFWAPGVAALLLVACGSTQPADPLDTARPSTAATSFQGQSEASSNKPSLALRAAFVAATQADASAEYAAARVDGGLQTTNPARGFLSRFRAAGVDVLPELGGPEVRLSMRTSHLGCASAPVAVGSVEPTADKNRVSYARSVGGVGVSEWYSNGPLGLEQGFTIEKPLACGGLATDLDGEALVAQIELDGDLIPSLADDGETVLFADENGNTVAHYGELYVHDANGKQLAATLSLANGGLSIEVMDDGAAYPLTIDPLIATEVTTFIDADPASSDDFGDAIAMDGNTAVLGVNTKNSYTGAAYVFTVNGGVWTQEAKLTPFDGLPYDNFGSRVAISGDTIAVGAYNQDAPGSYSAGAGYIFVRSAGVWTLEQKVVAPDPTPQAEFGDAVALDGDSVVFTTRQSIIYSGVAAGYVFVRSAGAWTLQQKVLHSGTISSGGSAATLDGDTMILGWPNTRVVYVFTRTAGVWSEQQQLTSVNQAIYDNFGESVALQGDTAFVGARSDGTHGVAAGAVYVFDRGGSTWSNSDILFGTGIAGLSYFGRSISVSNDTLLIGASGDGGSGNQYGAAWVYVRNAGTWSEQLKLVASDPAPYANLGHGVAVVGGTAVCGAPGFDGYGANAGKAYVFDVPTAIAGACGAVPPGAACDDGDPCTYGDTCNAGVCAGTPEVDTDADGVCDPVDNCPNNFNPSQLDLDNNGWGEACLSACIRVPVDYGASEDASISSASPGANFDATSLFISPAASSLLRFDLSVLPSQTIVSSADLTMTVFQTTGSATVNLHAITAPWVETGVTYSSFGGAFNPAVAASFTSAQGKRTVSVAALVQSWLDGSVANNGVLFEQASGDTRLRSSEFTAQYGEFVPQVRICYTAPGY